MTQTLGQTGALTLHPDQTSWPRFQLMRQAGLPVSLGQSLKPHPRAGCTLATEPGHLGSLFSQALGCLRGLLPGTVVLADPLGPGPNEGAN